MSYDLSKITSWTSYKSRARSESVQSEPLSAIERALQSKTDDCTIKSSTRHQNQEVLQQRLKLSDDETVQVSYKITRPHPALFLQAVSKAQSAEIAVDASKIANMTPSKQTKKRPRTTTANGSNIIFPIESENAQRTSSFLARPTISIDVTNLLDPPLLSEWLPGQDLSTSYRSESADKIELRSASKTDTSTSASNEKENLHPPKSELRAEIEKVIVANTAASISSQIINALEELSDKDWMEILPSHQLLNALGQPIVSTISKALGRLLSTFSSQALGTHILKVLIPVLFESLEADTMSKDCEESLNAISMLLVDRCGLGSLSKEEVLTLCHEIPQNTCGVQLRMGIAREYYSYRGRNKKT